MIKGGLFKRLDEKKSQKFYDITKKPLNKEQKIRKEKRRTTNETHIKTGTFHALS